MRGARSASVNATLRVPAPPSRGTHATIVVVTRYVRHSQSRAPRIASGLHAAVAGRWRRRAHRWCVRLARCRVTLQRDVEFYWDESASIDVVRTVAAARPRAKRSSTSSPARTWRASLTTSASRAVTIA